MFAYADRVGEMDSRLTRYRDHLFLLTRDGTVIGTRSGLAAPICGENFFTVFPAKREEVSELTSSLHRYVRSSLLLQGADGPYLFLRAFYGITGTLVAVIPSKETAELLRAPSRLSDLVEHLTLSRGMLAADGAVMEDHYNALTDFVVPYHASLFGTIPTGGNWSELTTAIALRAMRIASLCGCRLDYDLGGLGHLPVIDHDLFALAGFLFSACLAARRATKEHSLRLLVSRDGAEGPVIHALLDLLDPADPLTELSELERAIYLRGGNLFAVHHEKDPHLVDVRWPLCFRETSVQSAKQTPKTYYDGEIVLPLKIPD